MRAILNILVLAVLLAAFVLITPFTSFPYTEASGRAETSCEMKSVYTIDNLSYTPSLYSTFIESIFEKATRITEDHDYSDKELIRLGVWEDEAGIEHSLRTLSGTMYRYYAAQGCLPATSDDVIAALGGDTASLIGHLYNPITGKLYAGFTATEWDINSVNVEITTDINEARQILMNRYPEVDFDFGSPAYPEPTGAIRIVVYGEEPGSVIFDDYFF